MADLPAGLRNLRQLHGALTSFYTYPFIDAATLDYPRVFVNVVALMVGFVVLGLGTVFIDRALGKLLIRSEQGATV